MSGAPDASRCFEDLVAEAEAAPMDGWDFCWLDERATEEGPSWGYQRMMSERLARATAALDVETGGGEVLAGAPTLPPAMAATESWPPNLARATRLLHPRGAVVVATGDGRRLPRPAARYGRAHPPRGAVRRPRDADARRRAQARPGLGRGDPGRAGHARAAEAAVAVRVPSSRSGTGTA